MGTKSSRVGVPNRGSGGCPNEGPAVAMRINSHYHQREMHITHHSRLSRGNQASRLVVPRPIRDSPLPGVRRVQISAFGAEESTAASIILAAMGAAEVEAQKAMFVEALGAKLAASFSPPEGGVAAPKHERARFTAVARAAIERLPTETALRGKLLEDFGAISAALWEQYAKKHGRATAAALPGDDRPPCILAAGGVDLALASGSTDGTSLEKLVQLPWLGESHLPKAAAALQTAIAEDVFGVSDALRLASVASCGERGSSSPLAVAVLDATLHKLCATKKALPRHVAGARVIFHHLAQRPLLSASAPSDAPATLRRACAGYLQMCSLHGGPAATERRREEPAARCAARHIGLMLGQGRFTADGTSSAPLEQLSALLYSLFTGSETRDAPAGSFNRIVMDTLVSLLPLEVPQRWRPTAPPDSYLQLLIVLRLAAQRPTARPADAGKPAKGRKVARKLCEEVVETLKPKIEVATIPRAVAVAARSENGGSDPGAELAWWPVDRLRLLLAVRCVRAITHPTLPCNLLAK
jgi:hypothetical protein